MSIREYRLITHSVGEHSQITWTYFWHFLTTSYPYINILCTKNKPFADQLPTIMCLRNLWKLPRTTDLSCLLHRWQTWEHFSVLFQCFPCWKTRFFFTLPFCFWILMLELHRPTEVCTWYDFNYEFVWWFLYPNAG